MVRLCTNLTLGILGVALAGGLCELLLRFAIPVSTVAYRYDSQVGFTLEPGGSFRWVNPDYDVQIATNSAGFHDVEHSVVKPPNTYRVVVVGDSLIEALQVPVADSFARLLERHFQEWMPRPTEVINLGVSGNGPAQYYRLLEQRGMAYRPDLVIMAVTTINDFRNTLPELERDALKPYYDLGERGELLYIGPPADADRGLLKGLKRLLRRSLAVRVLAEKIQLLGVTAKGTTAADDKLPTASDWNVYLRTPPPVWEQAYRMTLRMIEESHQLAQRHGASFLVVIIAPKALVENRLREAVGTAPVASLDWDANRPFRAIERLAQEKGFAAVNLYEDFENDYLDTGKSASWEHDGHWNRRGNILAASITNRYVREHSAELLPSSGQDQQNGATHTR